MTEEIKELEKRLKLITKQQEKLSNEANDIRFKIRDLIEKEQQAKVEKKFHVGDYFLDNIGIVNYHCDVLRLYEVLSVDLGRWPTVNVREYKIGYSDGNFYTHIEKITFRNFANVGKKITQKEALEVKEIIYNPEQYENSKWNVKER